MANILNLDQAINADTTDLKCVRAVYDLDLQAMNGGSTSKRRSNFWQKDDDLTAECETHFLQGTDVFFFPSCSNFQYSFVKDVANLILWR